MCGEAAHCSLTLTLGLCPKPQPLRRDGHRAGPTAVGPSPPAGGFGCVHPARRAGGVACRPDVAPQGRNIQRCFAAFSPWLPSGCPGPLAPGPLPAPGCGWRPLGRHRSHRVLARCLGLVGARPLRLARLRAAPGVGRLRASLARCRAPFRAARLPGSPAACAWACPAGLCGLPVAALGLLRARRCAPVRRPGSPCPRPCPPRAQSAP